MVCQSVPAPDRFDLAEISADGEFGAQIAAKFFRGLGDPTRLRIVMLLLEHGEMAVGELVEAVDGLQGRVSSHLACLRYCGLVVDHREGRNVFYSVPDERLRTLLPLALAMIADNANHIAACHCMGDPEPPNPNG